MTAEKEDALRSAAAYPVGPESQPTPYDCGHSCCDERCDPMHDHFLAADNCPACVNGTP